MLQPRVGCRVVLGVSLYSGSVVCSSQVGLLGLAGSYPVEINNCLKHAGWVITSCFEGSCCEEVLIAPARVGYIVMLGVIL